MLGMISREARRLGVGEKRRLTGLLRTQVPDGFGKAGGESDACPRCGGTHLVRVASVFVVYEGWRGLSGCRVLLFSGGMPPEKTLLCPYPTTPWRIRQAPPS